MLTVLNVVLPDLRKERVPPAKPLHIVVMSATMNVDHFSEYFDKAPVIYVEGRQHKVDVMYSAESQSDYVYASLGKCCLWMFYLKVLAKV